jgi:hypothetical protein
MTLPCALRRAPLHAALALLATLGFAASARADIGAAPVTFTVDSHADSGSGGGSATSPDILTAGRLYAITVSGTYAPESATLWSAPTSTQCGSPEAAPTEGSEDQPTRKASRDAFSRFATVVAPGGSCPTLPARNQRFQFDFRTGDLFVLQPMNVPAGSAAPRADHRYVFVARGQGTPVTTLISDSNPNDNDGVLTVSVRLATASDCFGNAACLAIYAQSGSAAGGSQPGPSVTTTTPSGSGHAAKCSKRPRHGLVVHFRRTSRFVSARILVKGKHARRLKIAKRDRHHGSIRVRKLPRAAFTIVVRGRRHGHKRVVVIARRHVRVACARKKS